MIHYFQNTSTYQFSTKKLIIANLLLRACSSYFTSNILHSGLQNETQQTTKHTKPGRKRTCLQRTQRLFLKSLASLVCQDRRAKWTHKGRAGRRHPGGQAQPRPGTRCPRSSIPQPLDGYVDQTNQARQQQASAEASCSRPGCPSAWTQGEDSTGAEGHPSQ